MTADSIPTRRYLIHTVGLDGPLVDQPTLFTRCASSESSLEMPTGYAFEGPLRQPRWLCHSPSSRHVS